MKKQSKDNPIVIVHPNAVNVKGDNRRITIIKQKPSKNKFVAKNVIFIKSLTSDTGYNAGVQHHLSDNGKIKVSSIGLSTEGLFELYICLGSYLEELSNNNINHKSTKNV